MIAALILVAVAWTAVSCAFGALIPWGLLERDERWLGWCLVLLWPLILVWMLFEVRGERRRAGL